MTVPAIATGLPWKPLGGMLFLAVVGGLMWETFPDLLRLWGRHQGYTLSQLDTLTLLVVWGNFIQIILGPLFASPPPWGLARWGIRRGWLVLFLVCMVGLLVLLTFLPFLSKGFLVCACFFMVISKSYDSLTTISQMNAAGPKYWGILESLWLNGYRLGIAVAANGALFLWSGGGTLSQTFAILACCLVIGLATLMGWSGFAFLQQCQQVPLQLPPWRERFLSPFRNFLRQPGWYSLLVLFLVYRSQDGLFNAVRSFFFMDHGLSLMEVAFWIKTCGMILLSLGGIAAGFFLKQRGAFRTLVMGLVVHGGAFFLLFVCANLGLSTAHFIFFSLIEQWTKGFSTVAVMSSQMMLCRHASPEDAVTRSAIFGSLMWGGMGLMGSFSGHLVERWGWSGFFWCIMLANLAAFAAVFRIKSALHKPPPSS